MTSGTGLSTKSEKYRIDMQFKKFIFLQDSKKKYHVTDSADSCFFIFWKRT